MNPNNVMEKSAEKKKKKRLVLSIKTNKEIISKYERRIHLVDLVKVYGHNPLTIGTILKQSHKARTSFKGLSIMSKMKFSRAQQVRIKAFILQFVFSFETTFETN